jgi:hypothetical protein
MNNNAENYLKTKDSLNVIIYYVNLQWIFGTKTKEN